MGIIVTLDEVVWAENQAVSMGGECGEFEL